MEQTGEDVGSNDDGVAAEPVAAAVEEEAFVKAGAPEVDTQIDGLPMDEEPSTKFEWQEYLEGLLEDIAKPETHLTFKPGWRHGETLRTTKRGALRRELLAEVL